MSHRVMGVGLLVVCFGCSDTSSKSAAKVEPTAPITPAREDKAPDAAKDKAVEIAKRAVMAREKWASNGWPEGAEVYVYAFDTSGPKGRYWLINVLAPLEHRSGHLLIKVDDTGTILEYGPSW